MADEDLPLSAEARFAEVLAELPAVERSALALSEIGGLDTEEIAARLGTEPAVARKLLERARAAARMSLAGSRRGLATLLPVQSWWFGGASPAARAVGLVAAAVVGTGVATGGASASQPSAVPVRDAQQPVVSSSAQAAPARQPVARRGVPREAAPGRSSQASSARATSRPQTAARRASTRAPVAATAPPRPSPTPPSEPEPADPPAAAPAPAPPAAEPAPTTTAIVAEPLPVAVPEPELPASPPPVEVPPLPVAPPPLPTLP